MAGRNALTIKEMLGGTKELDRDQWRNMVDCGFGPVLSEIAKRVRPLVFILLGHDEPPLMTSGRSYGHHGRTRASFTFGGRGSRSVPFN